MRVTSTSAALGSTGQQAPNAQLDLTWHCCLPVMYHRNALPQSGVYTAQAMHQPNQQTSNRQMHASEHNLAVFDCRAQDFCAAWPAFFSGCPYAGRLRPHFPYISIPRPKRSCNVWYVWGLFPRPIPICLTRREMGRGSYQPMQERHVFKYLPAHRLAITESSRILLALFWDLCKRTQQDCSLGLIMLLAQPE